VIQANFFDGKFDGKNRRASSERSFAVIIRAVNDYHSQHEDPSSVGRHCAFRTLARHAGSRGDRARQTGKSTLAEHPVPGVLGISFWFFHPQRKWTVTDADGPSP
jgi:hypothetical protein